ncbi:MAG: hypothetical protein LBL86_11235 [Coriobacteriales bacterium]|jgi:hypothetical protein|nr:hypothetical protein [Coriobacteriales bacterium]
MGAEASTVTERSGRARGVSLLLGALLLCVAMLATSAQAFASHKGNNCTLESLTVEVSGDGGVHWIEMSTGGNSTQTFDCSWNAISIRAKAVDVNCTEDSGEGPWSHDVPMNAGSTDDGTDISSATPIATDVFGTYSNGDQPTLLTVGPLNITNLDDVYFSFWLAEYGANFSVVRRLHLQREAPEPMTASPASATFDLNTDSQADVAVTLTPGDGVFANAVTAAEKSNPSAKRALTQGSDYSVSGNIVTISKAFLATLTAGDYIVEFAATLGVAPTVALSVVDTTPPPDPGPDPGPTDPTAAFKNGINKKAVGDKTELVFIIETTLPTVLPAVSVDGSALDASQYTITSGSVVVTLAAGYLDTLSVGTHTLLVEFDDGTRASGTFSIQAADDDEDGDDGDDGGGDEGEGNDSDNGADGEGGSVQGTGSSDGDANNANSGNNGNNETALPTTGDDFWMLAVPLSLMALGAIALYRRRVVK